MRGKLKCCDVSVVISGDTGTQRLLESGSLCVLGSSVSSGRSVVELQMCSSSGPPQVHSESGPPQVVTADFRMVLSVSSDVEELPVSG